MNIYALALIVLAWQPPVDTNGLAGYRVSRGLDGGQPTTNWVMSAAVTTFTNAAPAGKWRYWVEPLFRDGRMSEKWDVGIAVPRTGALTLDGIIEQSSDPDGPWFELSTVSLNVPWTETASRFYRLRATLGTNAAPAGPTQ